MCGICGFAGFSDEGLLHRMTDALSHRGLDDKGHFVSADACLGFRRLSIIDLALGNQPLANENKSVWSVCNGEIYNFREIKDKLLKKGHIFHTQTDTEILPHAYEEWGIDLVRRLNGMFAFALWDAQAKKLFLVRDRLGIRPLHYAVSGGKIIFASEAKAILRSPDFKKELERHILLEDTIIKPLLEKKGAMASKPDIDTTGEHEKIKSLMEKIERDVTNTDTTKLEDELVETLQVHNEKEEQVLYNWVDQSLTVKEKAEVLGEMFKWVTQ